MVSVSFSDASELLPEPVDKHLIQVSISASCRSEVNLLVSQTFPYSFGILAQSIHIFAVYMFYYLQIYIEPQNRRG